jgi:hypothetical protein
MYILNTVIMLSGNGNGNGNGLLTHLVVVTLIYNVFTIFGYKKGIYSIYLHVIH